MALADILAALQTQGPARQAALPQLTPPVPLAPPPMVPLADNSQPTFLSELLQNGAGILANGAQQNQQSQSIQSSPQYTGSSSSQPGTTVTSGPTKYDYQTWAFPFAGLDPNSPLLVTKRGVTLQAGPMQSLIDIARASDLMKGTREIGMIGQGYRSPQQQAYAAQHNPNAAPYGHSYHPEGLAIDASWWSDQAQLNAALAAAGWNQFDRGAEPWHYSYGVTG